MFYPVVSGRAESYIQYVGSFLILSFLFLEFFVIPAPRVLRLPAPGLLSAPVPGSVPLLLLVPGFPVRSGPDLRLLRSVIPGSTRTGRFSP